MPPIFQLPPGQKLLLASASPRRRELLASLGLEFAVCEAPCAEPPPEPGEDGTVYAARMAALKAQAIAPRPDTIIIAADTVVCIADAILGKPHKEAEALRMLRILNGHTHVVCTAVHIGLPNGGAMAFQEVTQVSFGSWPEAVLATYAATGEPLDKAGAYAIQGQGAFLLERINGSYTNVVGLPLEKTARTLLAYSAMVINK